VLARYAKRWKARLSYAEKDALGYYSIDVKGPGHPSFALLFAHRNQRQRAVEPVYQVTGLSTPARSAWRNAKVRDFNIGHPVERRAELVRPSAGREDCRRYRRARCAHRHHRLRAHRPTSPNSEVMEVPTRCIAIEVMSARNPTCDLLTQRMPVHEKDGVDAAAGSFRVAIGIRADDFVSGPGALGD